MPDANEEIVRRYLELHGYFVRSRVRYKYTTPDGGSGWSDIDLCGITPDGRAIAVEVKGWHTEKFTGSYRENWPTLFHFAERPEAMQVLSDVLGNETYDKILVISELGPVGGQAFIDDARSLGVEIVTFPAILKRLISETALGPGAVTDGEHMIRVLKRYGFLSPEQPATADDPLSP
jgi:hypothetical protein